MTLFQASISTGFLLFIFGALLIIKRANFTSALIRFPRSKLCSYWFVGIATLWFLWRHVVHLSEADFGDYKLLIGMVVVGVAGLSFVYVTDFLAVRGWSMLVLLYAREVLDAAFLQEPQSRLLLVFTTYFFIVIALYWGAWPYRMRDWMEWMGKKKSRFVILGGGFLLAGLLLFILSFIY